jgi:tRNA G10  N-methylase Trm11
MVLNTAPIAPKTPNGTLIKELYKSTDMTLLQSLKNSFPGYKTYRVMIQHGNQLIHVPRDFTKKIIASIAEQTHLSYSPLTADIEFWFLIRNERLVVLGIKSTKDKTSDDQKQDKGELRPEMAHLLNLLSEPAPTDIYLDPFAGHGSLPSDRMANFPYRQIYLSDQDRSLMSRLRHQIKGKHITIKDADALRLTYLNDASVNKIVTDPPWGVFQMKDVNYVTFYHDMLKEMVRVIQPKGVIVILTGKPLELQEALFQYSETLAMTKKLNTLVNGKKASVFVLKSRTSNQG